MCKGKESKRNYAGIDNLTPWQQRGLFQNNNNSKVIFYNLGNKKCQVNYAHIDTKVNQVFLNVTIDILNKKTITSMSIDRFTQLVQAREFRLENRELERKYFA